ncbi:Hypothetical predicted protein [Olea europaea subsp. europaea]|uniref:Uncharacterized protein n=1 Tax=Olea europaea subsp. europaea TaxID=158383 RepID=A0A8S0PMB7_OLEEU|nr:Hypothetical predicted protein [Olea europaea subsp. europaea]
MSGTLLGHGRDAAVSGTRCAGHVENAAASVTRCAGHVQNAAGTLPNFQVFLGSFWDAVYRSCPGRVQAMAGTQLDFQVMKCRLFSGHVQTMTGTEPDFQVIFGTRPDHGISRQFVGTVCWSSPGRIPTVTKTQLDFLRFLGNFWDTVCRPCLKRIMAKAGTERDFHAILGSYWDTLCRPSRGYGRGACRLSGIFRQFLEHGVQAMSGMRLGHGGDAA